MSDFNKSIALALDTGVDGLVLDMVAKKLDLSRKRRRWWFDESDWSLRRRCQIAFVRNYNLVSLKIAEDL